MFKRMLSVAGILCTLFIGQAHAHAMLESSSPANNAVLATAHKNFSLTFGHPTKLVMLKLDKGEEVIPLRVDSEHSAKGFFIPLPPLGPGKYAATWSTLSDDGHPMKGTITFTVTGK